MDDTTKPEDKTKALARVEPYHLGEFAKGGSIDFITQGNVSIPLSLQLLKGIVPVRQGDREPSTTEMVMFANTVIEQKCNCYLNECWLVLMRGKYVPIIAAQKRIAKAQSIPSYDGYEWGWIDKGGQRWPSGPENKVKEVDIFGAWGRIYFKNRKVPFYHEIFRSEYQYPKSERKITMLLKTLRDQLHKYAFASEMGNLCTENEPYEEPLPAPVSDVLPREQRRTLAVPSSTVDTSRAPVPIQGTMGASKQMFQEPVAIPPAAVPAAIPIQTLEAIAEVAKEAKARQEKPELVTFVCKKCGQTYQYGKEEGRGVQCECGGGVLLAEPFQKEDEPVETILPPVPVIPTAASTLEKKLEPSILEKKPESEPPAGGIAALYVEVNNLYAEQNGRDFIEFAAYVLCVDEDEVDQASKFTVEQLNQIKVYIETNGVAIN